MGFSPSLGFPRKAQEMGWESTPGGVNKATSKEGNFLSEGGYRGYNSGRWSCWTLFCVKGFSSKEFFEYVMIVLLKMNVAGKNFGKICLKATKDTLFPICGLWSGEGQGDSGGGRSKVLACRGATPAPIPSLSWTFWSHHKEYPVEGAGPAYCNEFEKSEWEYLLSKQQIYRI